MTIEKLKKAHVAKKKVIEKRLREFRKMRGREDKAIFAELAFCLCVPQTSAKKSWAAITELANSGELYRGKKNSISNVLLKRGVRFHNNKADWITNARKNFSNIKFAIKNLSDPHELREWLVKNVKGMGYKLAGQFMRNIGVYDKHTILDVHILKNLQRFGVIHGIPKTISVKRYFEIENKFIDFSRKVGIPIAHLDLLFWSNETGEIFK
ncbi:MAG: N-glycosylase/DNA lyase [Candidatus Colwellbacteria bacterium]|nr:N-glycosylase/DNA lyase [Candidatus Colwellbacteria bacterium]